MTRKLRTALTALVLLGLVAGGAEAAAADTTTIDKVSITTRRQSSMTAISLISTTS
jgi:hypothetical protein